MPSKCAFFGCWLVNFTNCMMNLLSYTTTTKTSLHFLSNRQFVWRKNNKRVAPDFCAILYSSSLSFDVSMSLFYASLILLLTLLCSLFSQQAHCVIECRRYSSLPSCNAASTTFFMIRIHIVETLSLFFVTQFLSAWYLHVFCISSPSDDKFFLLSISPLSFTLYEKKWESKYHNLYIWNNNKITLMQHILSFHVSITIWSNLWFLYLRFFSWFQVSNWFLNKFPFVFIFNTNHEKISVRNTKTKIQKLSYFFYRLWFLLFYSYLKFEVITNSSLSQKQAKKKENH